jgi:hypothetical protein
MACVGPAGGQPAAIGLIEADARSWAARPMRPGKALLCLEHALRAGQAAAGLDSLAGKPSLLHLEHIAHRLRGAVTLLAARLHVGDVHDLAAVVDEGGGQGNEGIAHPEALTLGFLKHEHHALVGAKAGAEHQAAGAGAEIGGDFGANEMDARLEFDHGQGRVGLFLRGGGLRVCRRGRIAGPGGQAEAKR